MNTASTALAPLPPAILSLLDAFHQAHPGADVRLWLAERGGWLPLYPTDAVDGGPVESALRRSLSAERERSYELEVRGAAPASAVEVLAEALAQILAYEREARLAAQELTERYEEINLLYSISEILGSVLSLEAAARRILAEVADQLGAGRASLWVQDEGALRLIAAVGEEGLSGPIRVDDPHSVTARVFRERQPLNLGRGERPPAGSPLEPRPHDAEAYLSVPINYTPPEGGGRTVGVITLIGGKRHPEFTAGDARLLTAIASQIGAALETHRLVREGLRQERVVRELELAHDLQMKLLPSSSKLEGTAQVAARCLPAEAVGGDFYNLFPLSGERLGILIGDVSSHGFPAALIMALTMSAIAIYAQEGGPPGDVLRRVHYALIQELENTEMSLALFYAVLDPAGGRLRYANAGHPHAFRIPATGAAERLGAGNPPLGTQLYAHYGEREVPWVRGQDLLCLFTDGLSDALATDGTPTGEARLLEEVLKLRERAPAEVLEHVYALAASQRADIPADDRTAVLVRA